MKSLQGYSKTKSGPGAQFRTYSGPFLALWSGSRPSPEFRTFVVPLPQFSLYSLLRRSTITHQKRLGMDRIHWLSVDNQIFCTTSDLSVLSGALSPFLSVWCQLHLSKDFWKVEKGIIFKLYNQQNHFLRVDQTFSIKKVKLFKIMIVA